MATEDHPDIQLTLSGRRIIPTDTPADADTDVFIPLDRTVRELKKILALPGSHITFIRAPVASGKTTLAKFLTTKCSNEFVKVRGNAFNSKDQWCRNIIEASGKSFPVDAVVDALLEIGKQRKTIVIDEAHLLFPCPEIMFEITKNLEAEVDKPRILLFSASGSAVSPHGLSIVTPAEISKKYVWYPPVSDYTQLAKQLEDAGVRLTPESVSFFVKLCGGNRGIIMRAMNWVRDCQNKDEDDSGEKAESQPWDIIESVKQVRKTLEDSRTMAEEGWSVGLKMELKQSRAVRVNGQYSDLNNIPPEFGLVLFGGAKSKKDLNDKERDLTINGFLFPQRKTMGEREFEKYDWTDSLVKYGVPNPIMVEYYSDLLPTEGKLKRKFIEKMRVPCSGADFLARVLPYMTFSAVVDPPIPSRVGTLKTPLSSDNLPYEDDYNDAMADAFKTTLNFSVSRPKNPTSGKTDVVVTFDGNKTCAIESIMAKQTLVGRRFAFGLQSIHFHSPHVLPLLGMNNQTSHVEHATRFLNPTKSNYHDGFFKVLLTIGSNTKMVRERVQQTADGMRGKPNPPEIVGVVVSLLHDSYEMHLPGKAPLFFPCDFVAKSLEIDKGRVRLVPVQECVQRDGTPILKKLKSIEK